MTKSHFKYTLTPQYLIMCKFLRRRMHALLRTARSRMPKSDFILSGEKYLPLSMRDSMRSRIKQTSLHICPTFYYISCHRQSQSGTMRKVGGGGGKKRKIKKKTDIWLYTFLFLWFPISSQPLGEFSPVVGSEQPNFYSASPFFIVQHFPDSVVSLISFQRTVSCQHRLKQERATL